MSGGDHKTTALAGEDRIEVDRLVAEHAGSRGSLLPLLHAIQAIVGHVPDELVGVVAQGLNLSRADVHGVVTFYHDFRRQPAGEHVVKLCRAEACQARGSDAVARHAAELFGLAMGTTRADARVTLEPVYCLGLCAIGPNALVDGVPFGRLNTQRLADIKQRLSL